MGGSPLRFLVPDLLWLLLLPGSMLVLWHWRIWRRRADVRRCLSQRMTPVRERFQLAGPWVFWLCLIAALACGCVALARPEVLQGISEAKSVDLVVVQDASTSMRVADVAPDRWQRSMTFIRALVEALPWKGDRVALAVFSAHAMPQVRLARDPNILLFFLDHLATAPPNQINDDASWDTNAEEGIYWGLKIVRKDEELHGRTSNPQAIIVISDGQVWSGQVATSLAQAARRHVPVSVVGVGTSGGGIIPTSDKARPRVAAADGVARRRALLRDRSRVGSGHRGADRQRRAAPGGAWRQPASLRGSLLAVAGGSRDLPRRRGDVQAVAARGVPAAASAGNGT